MIYVRSQLQTHFADDLRPQVERDVSVLPGGEGKFGPQVALGTSSRCVHKSSADRNTGHRDYMPVNRTRSLRAGKFFGGSTGTPGWVLVVYQFEEGREKIGRAS